MWIFSLSNKKLNPKGLVFLLALFLLFVFRLNQALPLLASPPWGRIYGHEAELVGQVVEPPQIIGSRQKIILDYVTTSSDGALSGKILVTTRLYPRFEYGQTLKLKGKVQEPPVFEGFDYKRYLALNGIYAVLYWPEIWKLEGSPSSQIISYIAPVYRFRSQVQERIAKILPEPHAALLSGIVFGIQGSFAPDTYQALQKAGVLHVVVASGYNILIVSGFLLALSSWLGRYQAALLTAAGLIVYAILAGLQPPILRAVIMGGGSLLASLLGRQKSGLFWLFLSGLTLLLIKPYWLFTLSFLLSFLASLALLTLHPWVERKCGFLPQVLRESFATTFSVQLLTAPLIWYSFRQIYPVSLLVNTLVLFTIDFLMPAGAVLAGVSFASLRLAQILAWPVWLVLEYFLTVVRSLT